MGRHLWVLVGIPWEEVTDLVDEWVTLGKMGVVLYYILHIHNFIWRFVQICHDVNHGGDLSERRVWVEATADPQFFGANV